MLDGSNNLFLATVTKVMIGWFKQQLWIRLVNFNNDSLGAKQKKIQISTKTKTEIK